jgi:ATP-binding cassette subfamily C protein
MPSLQQAFQSYARLRFGAAALTSLHEQLVQSGLPDGHRSATEGSPQRSRETMPLTGRLELDAVTFAYPGAPNPTLRSVVLTIEANRTVGITGPTGAGKTTLVDVIIGLLRPQAGEIRINGCALTNHNLRAWQNGIGYVPQQIYLSDDTIWRNIALGVPDLDIDRHAVELAARIAHLHDFITRDLPDGYGTTIGERGVRLSGGQRQRLGIARALYHDPSLLVFDEATNALDQDTEAAVMDAIDALAGTRTILMIAHRLTSLRVCDAWIQVTADRRVVTGAVPVPAAPWRSKCVPLHHEQVDP